jgi:hypothetical protein
MARNALVIAETSRFPIPAPMLGSIVGGSTGNAMTTDLRAGSGGEAGLGALPGTVGAALWVHAPTMSASANIESWVVFIWC